MRQESAMHDVVGLTFGSGYPITLRFADGFERTIDFDPSLLDPRFGPLRDIHLLRQARVNADFGTIIWSTGNENVLRRTRRLCEREGEIGGLRGVREKSPNL